MEGGGVEKQFLSKNPKVRGYFWTHCLYIFLHFRGCFHENVHVLLIKSKNIWLQTVQLGVVIYISLDFSKSTQLFSYRYFPKVPTPCNNLKNGGGPMKMYMFN